MLSQGEINERHKTYVANYIASAVSQLKNEIVVAETNYKLHIETISKIKKDTASTQMQQQSDGIIRRFCIFEFYLLVLPKPPFLISLTSSS